MVKDRGMSDHTRPYIPVLMETFIYDLGLGSLPNHTDHGKGLLLAVITWMLISVWFSLIGSANITELPTIPVQHCSST